MSKVPSTNPAPGAKGVTLQLRDIPTEWAVENGYAETVDRRYRGYYSEGIRWLPGADKERVLFHFLYGRPAPTNHWNGVAKAQWEYRPSGNLRDRMLRAQGLAQ